MYRSLALATAVLVLLFGALLPFSAAQAQSSDATLRALTVEVSTDGINFTAIGIDPEFTAARLSHDASVSSSHTHVRVLFGAGIRRR